MSSTVNLHFFLGWVTPLPFTAGLIVLAGGSFSSTVPDRPWDLRKMSPSVIFVLLLSVPVIVHGVVGGRPT